MEDEQARLQELRKWNSRPLQELERIMTELLNETDRLRRWLKEKTELNDRLRNALQARRDLWTQASLLMFRRIAVFCRRLMAGRGYNAKVKACRASHTLSVYVAPAGEGIPGEARELSGGERSFALTALLLAVWQASESPVCGVGEFDVCLAAVNRECATKFLVEEAGKTRRQYIFVTSLQIHGVHNGELVRLWEVGAKA